MEGRPDASAAVALDDPAEPGPTPATDEAGGARGSGGTAIGLILLAAALVLSVWEYWPALFSRWDSDDFVFLRSAIRSADRGVFDAAFRDLDGDRGAFRPFALLLFIGLYRVVGDEPAVFHGVLLAAHLATVLMVFVLVRRMFGAASVAGVAALLVATHPVGFQSVTWVAAISTWGIPLALASWWLLIGAADRFPRSARSVAAIALFLVAVMFRESAGLVVFAMLAWFWAERGLRRAVTVTAPFFVLAAIALVAGKWYTRDSPTYGTISSNWRHHAWVQLQRAWVPSEHTGLLGDVQAGLALLLLAAPFVALYLGHRRIAAAAIGFLATVVGVSLAWAGDDPRYFYAPAAFLAVAIGAGLATLVTRAGRRTRTAGWVACAGAVVLSGWWVVRTRENVDHWVATSPASYSDFVDQARRELGTLPNGTHVFVANVPLELALFDGLYLDAITDVLWPESDVATELAPVERVEDIRARLAPDERLLVFRPDQYGCAALAEQAAPVNLTYLMEASASTEEPFEVTVAKIGPMRDGLGTIAWESNGRGQARWRMELPWLAPSTTPWRSGAHPVRLALVPSADGLSYDVFVDGELAFRFATFEQLGRGRARTFGVEVGPFDDLPAGVEVHDLGPGPCSAAR